MSHSVPLRGWTQPFRPTIDRRAWPAPFRNSAGSSRRSTYCASSTMKATGELRQRYREGQKDQVGALGLVVNLAVL